MKAIDKAIWYIESHYREHISLESLADVAGVSRYHLSRIFCYTIGQPISRYIRLRRLSTAAIALAAGETDILDLALSIGYGSHEAFTRAFKEHFSITPEQVRAQGNTGELNLVGLSRFYPFEKVAEIPDQWQSFAALIPCVTSEDKPFTYGVIYNGGDDSFDYLSGVKRPTGRSSPQNMVCLKVLPQSYLVFRHPGHVATLRETCEAIWSDWLPASSRTPEEAPWFERYGREFDPVTGKGGLEIWIPVSS